MATFIINKNRQTTGEHEVHNASVPCTHMPDVENQVLVGNFIDCHGALNAARNANPSLSIDGCAYCCPACHTR